MVVLCQSRNCPLSPARGIFLCHNENVHGGFMNIKFTDDQLDRFNQALDRAMDCPFIQDDDETWDDLAKLQEILNQCV